MSSPVPLPAADYEPSDARPGALLVVGAGLIVGLLLSLVVSFLFYAKRFPGGLDSAGGGRQTSFHESAEARTDIAADWARQDAAVRTHLHTYGWVDRAHGVVRIPIDVAMERILAESSHRPGGQP